MTINNYSQQDTAILKGFAILSICLHNFLHQLIPTIGENEFYFAQVHVCNFFSNVFKSPIDFIETTIIYLGHYGVQIFIFISGYGLTISMLKKKKNWLNFVIDRLKKLYPLLLTAVIFYILFFILMNEQLPTNSTFTKIGYKLLFINTLLPNQGLSINGPWWFFCLIFQFYLIFPLLFNLFKKYNFKAFLLICTFAYSWIFLSQYLFNDIYGVFLLQNFPGHLPEFCLGMLLAFNKDTRINNIWFFIAFVTFCLGNYYKLFFPFTFLAVTIIYICSYQFLKTLKFKKTTLKKFFIYFGNISMTIFAIHGFIRVPFIKLANTSLNTPLGHIVTIILFIITIVIIALSANHVYEFLMSLFNKIKTSDKENKLSSTISYVLQVAIIIFSIYLLFHFCKEKAFYANKNNTPTYVNTDTIKVTNTQKYGNVASLTFDEKDKILKINGSFDIKSNDDNSKLPFLIIGIDGYFWKKLIIPEEFNSPNFNTYDFHLEYSCSFIDNLKGRKLKLFFLNENMSNFEYKDIKVSINTK